MEQRTEDAAKPQRIVQAPPGLARGAPAPWWAKLGLKLGLAAIGIHGSIRLAQSLLSAGLVDELRLVIAPATVGSGRRLFESDELRRWDLITSEGSPSGELLLHYRRRSD